MQFEKKIQKVEVDFLTSVCKISDRRIFFVDIQEGERTKFLYENLERRGQNCEQCYMIDGSVYLIKMDFLKKVIHSKNTNKTFWDGNFQHIINDSPFLDIDTLQDMNKFEYIRDHFI
ncbi:hypothetical protein CAPN004_21800 [Capnocytophaga cynodegmi]|nr:hypothetical protein CAPN004_21800 [Capnocytophaga cynodegmi]